MDALTLQRWRKIITDATVGTRLKGTTEAFVRGVAKNVSRYSTLAARPTTVFIISESTIRGRRIKGIYMMAGGRKVLVSLSTLQGKKLTNRDKALGAMRSLIADQIENYRANRKRTLNVDFACPLSGKDLRLVSTHVDHYSISFSQLANDWCALSAVDLDKVAVTNQKFRSAKLNTSWQAYHLANADLKLVEARANLSKGKRSPQHHIS